MVKHFRVHGMLRTRLDELGISVSDVLRRAGLPQDLFDQVRIFVTTEEMFALWRAIGEVSKDPAIGLKLAIETKTERFHPMALAALSSETFGAAVEHMARYKRLSAPEKILSEKDADEWSIQFRFTLAADAEPQVLLDHCFAWTVTIARQGIGKRITPVRIELVQPRSNVKILERHFGCPVVCGARRDALIFRATDADCPFITRNAELLDLLAPQFEEALKLHSSEDSFTELVRGAIQQRLTGNRPSIENIASDLHITPRTLQRRLQDSGASFQRILDDARHQMARHYLRNSVLELNEAAYLLGYEDTNSFSRAFRTWEGVPPGHWRETQRATDYHN
jgi:AraC-like DNA-binding protein